VGRISREEIEEHLNKLKAFNEWERKNRAKYGFEACLDLICQLRKLIPDEAKARIPYEDYENLKKVREALAILDDE